MFVPDCARLHPSETAYKILIYCFGALEGFFACSLGGGFCFVSFLLSTGGSYLCPIVNCDDNSHY